MLNDYMLYYMNTFPNINVRLVYCNMKKLIKNTKKNFE